MIHHPWFSHCESLFCLEILFMPHDAFKRSAATDRRLQVGVLHVLVAGALRCISPRCTDTAAAHGSCSRRAPTSTAVTARASQRYTRGATATATEGARNRDFM